MIKKMNKSIKIKKNKIKHPNIFKLEYKQNNNKKVKKKLSK